MLNAKCACRWVLACVLVLAGISGCTVAGEMGSTSRPGPSEAIPLPLEAHLPPDACAGPPALALDVAAASQAPTLPEIDPNRAPVLGVLGEEGASKLASTIAPSGGFCSLEVSEAAMLAITQAMRLVEQGKPEQARATLAEWLASLSMQPREGGRAGSKLAVLAQAGNAARQEIRDLLNAAAADQAAGGDGAAYSSAANQAFRDLFAGEITNAGFEESLRLAEEAWRLGENELGETAANRARKIWEEKLKADLEDFDPCTATKEEVGDLLNSLAQAMLLGVPGSFDDEGLYYQAVRTQAQAAAQQLFNQAAIKIGLPELTSPIPECTPGGHIEVRQTLAYAKQPCINAVPFTLSWQGNTARLEGSGSMECVHVEENLGGSPATLHQISNLGLSFSGTATSGSPGILEVTLTTTGEMKEYFTGFPEDSGQIFTEESPFSVPADGVFPLTFEFRQGARAELRGEGQEEAAFVFILHLMTSP